jgi:hypothetical protein
VKRTAPIRVMSFILLAACGAVCQSKPLSGTQGQEKPSLRSLPDAPSLNLPTRMEQFRTFVKDASAARINLGAIHNAYLRHTPEVKVNPTGPYKVAFTEPASGSFFDKYLYPSLLKQNPGYHPSTSATFLGRATYAASHILVTRDDSGKGTLNGPYFLGVLASVAIHTAHRPYWSRSASQPFNSFGSTLGSDAGINLLHEFGPALRQMAKGRQPKFVSKFQERITGDQNPAVPVFIPAR